MLKRAIATLSLTTGLLVGQVAAAETLEMTGLPQDAVVSRGLSMAQVEKRYGEPSRRVDAVGNPPISRWIYPEFVVYFEGQFVIHAVGTRPST
jgi:hypothetical protein